MSSNPIGILDISKIENRVRKHSNMNVNHIVFLKKAKWACDFPYEMLAFRNMISIFKNVAVAQGILVILGI